MTKAYQYLGEVNLYLDKSLFGYMVLLMRYRLQRLVRRTDRHLALASRVESVLRNLLNHLERN